MTPQLIIPALIARLQTDSVLSAYVPAANVLEGTREIGTMTAFPTIMIETDGDMLLDQTYPWERLILPVKLGGFIQAYDKNAQLSGLNGLLQFKNDIKRCLSQDDNLGLSDVYSVIWQSSKDNNTFYPIRGFIASVNIKYRQNRTTRA